MLQDHYVQQWADNLVIHLFVSDVRRWWDRIVSLDLESRYGVKTRAPQPESWGALVAGVVDPSGVLWRFTRSPPPVRKVHHDPRIRDHLSALRDR